MSGETEPNGTNINSEPMATGHDWGAYETTLEKGVELEGDLGAAARVALAVLRGERPDDADLDRFANR